MERSAIASVDGHNGIWPHDVNVLDDRLAFRRRCRPDLRRVLLDECHLTARELLTKAHAAATAYGYAGVERHAAATLQDLT